MMPTTSDQRTETSLQQTNSLPFFKTMINVICRIKKNHYIELTI
jgi:hypothetical protein